MKDHNMSLIRNIQNTSISFKTGRAFARWKNQCHGFGGCIIITQCDGNTNMNADVGDQNISSHHHHHIHFRALFSSTEGWAFWQVFLEGVGVLLERHKGDVGLYVINILLMSSGFWKISQMT